MDTHATPMDEHRAELTDMLEGIDAPADVAAMRNTMLFAGTELRLNLLELAEAMGVFALRDQIEEAWAAFDRELGHG